MTVSLPGAPVATCAACGLTTVVPNQFVPRRRSFRPVEISVDRICPRCAAKDQYRTNVVIESLLLAAVVSVVAIALLHPSSAKHDVDGDAMLSFILPFMLAQPVMVFVHEVAHAAAARLAGLRAPVIRIGSGHRLTRLRVGTLWVDVHLLPSSGLCFLGPGLKPFRGWRLFLAVAAGPGSHLLVILLMLAFAGAFGVHTLPFPLTNWFPALLTVNALLLLCGLLPMDVTVGGVKLVTDGKRLLRIWRASDSGAAWLDAGLVNILQLWIETARVGEARRWLDLAKEKSPPSLSLQLAEVMTLAAEKNWAAARVKAIEGFDATTAPAERAMFATWGAMATVYASRTLATAETLRTEFMRIFPWDPNAQVACATVLYAMRQDEQARTWLIRSRSHTMSWQARAAAAHLEAELASVEGKPAAERRWRRRAKSIDPTGIFMLLPANLRNG